MVGMRFSSVVCGIFSVFEPKLSKAAIFNVSFGTLEVQDVTNKSQCLKETRANQKDISHKNNVRQQDEQNNTLYISTRGEGNES